MTTGITSILKNILKFITFIGAVVAAVFLLRAFVIEPFVVPTGSMESTIEVGDCILAQKITLETGSDLKPGDIVVFKNPRPRNGVDILVKRVIATDPLLTASKTWNTRYSEKGKELNHGH